MAMLQSNLQNPIEIGNKYEAIKEDEINENSIDYLCYLSDKETWTKDERYRVRMLVDVFKQLINKL